MLTFTVAQPLLSRLTDLINQRIAMKFCAEIHGWINPTDFGNPPTFPLAPPAGQHFHLSIVIAQRLLSG